MKFEHRVDWAIEKDWDEDTAIEQDYLSRLLQIRGGEGWELCAALPSDKAVKKKLGMKTVEIEDHCDALNKRLGVSRFDLFWKRPVEE